jgi:hypothetical protein
MSFHRLDQARDKNFWSVRVSSDIRLIVHRTPGNLLVCYTGHHDDAYRWAERRKLEIHPKTGAAQLIEIRETVRDIGRPSPAGTDTDPKRKAPVCFHTSDDELLCYGVPSEWIADIRNADDDTLIDLAQHLPVEAAEALLDLAAGKKPRAVSPSSKPNDPFDHPHAHRRFKIIRTVEELKMTLDFSGDKN